MPVAAGKPRPGPLNTNYQASAPGPKTPRTPKTPQDEAIAYFSGVADGSPVQVWDLRLEDDGGPGHGKDYIRLPPPVTPYVLRFTIHAGSACTRNGVLMTDFPVEGGGFQRGNWKGRKLPMDLSKPVQVDFAISAPGAFCYFIEYDAEDGTRATGRKGYFNVDPIITLPARSEISLTGDVLRDTSSAVILDKTEAVPLDGLIILSIIAKWQGKISEWDPYLAEASRRGYNMIHYTPLHTRGSSGSPYSIADQLSFDPTLLVDPKATDGGVAQMEKVLLHAKKKYGLGGITDVVLNHTAFDSPWLLEHPEAGYSAYNTPHLAPAVALENALLALTEKLPKELINVECEADLDKLDPHVKDAIDAAELWQYYVIDASASAQEVQQAVTSGKYEKWTGEALQGKTPVQLACIALETPGFVQNLRAYSRPFCTTVSPEKAAGFILAAYPSNTNTAGDSWSKVVDVINVDLYKECNADLQSARDNIKGRLRYTRLEDGGPKLGEINKKNPLVEPLFTRLEHSAKTAKHPPSSLTVANNGWMWAADPLKNFAEYPSKAYIRREVIVWGDCVKLRFGKGPEDNPWLWNYMTEYCELLASLFDGFRLDNCHSTPLHVGAHMIDAGRRMNPDLYVMAELFTGSEEMDLTFVRELGLNSLVREAYNGNDNKDFSRILYRFGVGKPIGSMDAVCLSDPGELQCLYGKAAPRPCIVTPLHGSVPHAVFYDVTHDNESPATKRTAEDALSTGALVTFTKSALGSNKGFDDLYPKHLDLVTDTRMYNVTGPDDDQGIGRVKRILNHLHTEMMTAGFDEGHVHEEGEYIMIHRLHPTTHKGYMVIAHTAFPGSCKGAKMNPVKLSRTQVRFIFGASLQVRADEYKDDDKVHHGLPSTLESIAAERVKITLGEDDNGHYSTVTIPESFDPGSILVFATDMRLSPDLDLKCREGANQAFTDLDLVDLNVVINRADGEERDATGGDGVYDIPGYGKLVYCGFEGWMGPLRNIMVTNDLGHPLCEHLRQGPWAMDYVTGRLEREIDTFPRLGRPIAWLKQRFDLIRETVPSFLRPKYFALVIFEAYKASRRAVVEQQSEFVISGTEFTHDLALCSVQMYGLVKSASINPRKPVASLAAGLPHFTAGWARCWGRDVFISLRGLFLTTGDFKAAREHILAFSSTLKHGLIPNLLDSTRNPRYNSRDSPWWMIQNIQDYTKMAPDGLAILKDSVKRRFPADDTWVAWDDPKAFAYSSTIAEIIQEIVQRHAEGIEFREYNAGPNLDQDMRDEGFNQKIWTDWTTGFIHGGNRYNCGTWMDKNGSSAKAGNKGLPATPRDGAPIEITGLLKSTLTWLDWLSRNGHFQYSGVKVTVDGKPRNISYREWADLIQASFEKHYYVPTSPDEDSEFVIKPELVNRRGMYKDVYGTPADRGFSDYQLRCNFTLPMVVAPELFTPERAMTALRLADENIRGPLGMKTLDPADHQYHPYYDNENDGFEMAIAKGWNYHQGPEWGFPLGWFLSAWLHFDRLVGDGANDHMVTMHHISQVMLKLREHVENDPWRGLPELCNKDGAYCKDSCNTQAWSASTILDVIQEMHTIGKAMKVV